MSQRGVWCWVNDGHDGIWQWSLFYIPILTFSVIMLFFWVSALKSVWPLLKKQKTRTYFIKNICGGFFFFISFAFQCAHRIYESVTLPIIHPGNTTESLFDFYFIQANNGTIGLSPSAFSWELAHILFLSLIGTAGFFTYTLNSKNVITLRRICFSCSLTGISRRHEYEDLEELDDKDFDYIKDATDTTSSV